MRNALAAVAAGFALLAAGVVAQPAVAADDIRQVGSIELGTCYQQAWGVDPGLHLLIVEAQVLPGQSCGAPAGANFVLMVFSTRTLQRLAVVPITNPGGIDDIQVDTVHHRLLVLDSSASPAGGDTVSIYSISRLKSAAQPVPADATVSVPSTALGLAGAGSVSPGNLTGSAGDFSLHISGSAYDPATDQLYITVFENFGGFNALTSQNGPGADDVYVADVDLHAATVRWAQVLDACVYDTASTSLYHLGGTRGIGDPILVHRTPGGTELNVGCAYSRSPGLAPDSQGSGVGGILPGLTSGSMLTYSVPLDRSGAPVTGSVTYALGRTHAYGGVADPGDARIFYASAPVNDGQSLSASSSGASAVVYDAAQGVYDGAVTISSAANWAGGFQIATANHRLYSVGPDGVLVDSASSTPSGQGVWFSGYHCATAGLAVDAGLGRLIALPHTDCKSATSAVAGRAVVLEDDYQLAPAAAAPNPDSYTVQRAEETGVTDRQFDGHAEATGTRVRLVGGLHGAVSGAGFGLYDQVFGAFESISQEGGSTSVPDVVPADYATHELDLAQATGADLGNYQASAGSLAADSDEATREQLKQYDGADWPFQPTACSDPGTRQAQTQYASDTSSSVECQYGTMANSSSAAGPVTVTMYVAGQGQTTQTLPMPVDLGANISSATVQLTPDRGLVSTASSEVKNLTLALPQAGELRIDGVLLTITCAAHGRTGTAGCTTTRVLNGVSYAGSAVGSGSCTEAPGVDTCGTLLAALNKIRPGILIFRMPDPDLRAGYLGGSRGGYQSIGQREYYEHLQDQVLNYDDSEQVPGLQMVYVNDSISTPSRLDLQLGDVEAESHYGITLLPPPCTSCAGTGGLSLSAGPPPAPLHVAGTVKAPSLGMVVSRILQRVWNGLKVLLRSPAAALAAAALLLMLVSPLLMGMRRRQLELLLNEVSA